jgi:7-cyano-7-deazaguanine synthase
MIQGKAIVSLSGGMDSATVLGLAKTEVEDIETVGFTYGSKHNRYENSAAVDLAVFYGVSFTLIDLSSILANLDSDLLKSGGKIPEGHYEEESMRRTVVPGRNIVFASILAAIAMSKKAKCIYMGVHAGDHFIYPDCRPEFVQSMRTAIYQGTDKTVGLVTPFLFRDKRNILESGYSLAPQVPYHLTRTCYADQPVACGRCGACQERLASFAAFGRPDPIEYETREILPKK